MGHQFSSSRMRLLMLINLLLILLPLVILSLLGSFHEIPTILWLLAIGVPTIFYVLDFFLVLWASRSFIKAHNIPRSWAQLVTIIFWHYKEGHDWDDLIFMIRVSRNWELEAKRLMQEVSEIAPEQTDKFKSLLNDLEIIAARKSLKFLKKDKERRQKREKAKQQKERKILERAKGLSCKKLIQQKLDNVGTLEEAEAMLIQVKGLLREATELGVRAQVRQHIRLGDLSAAIEAISKAKRREKFESLITKYEKRVRNAPSSSRQELHRLLESLRETTPDSRQYRKARHALDSALAGIAE